jgi:hypothetical protein
MLCPWALTRWETILTELNVDFSDQVKKSCATLSLTF